MQLNPQILKLIKDLKLTEQEVVYFCLIFWFKKHYSKAEELLFVETANGNKVINLENEETYRINFLKLEEGELVLKYPLFVKEKTGAFKEFTTRLAETKLLGSRGHVNNNQDYTVYSINKETEEAFDSLPPVNIDTAVQVVLNYYESSKPAQKLSNYLKGSFIVDYQNYD